MYRYGTGSDCRGIYELICDLEKTVLPYEAFSDIYQRQLQSPDYACLIFEQGHRICGVLNLRFEEQLHHAERIAEILEFAVSESYRNQGIGKELLESACELAREQGCVQIEVDCNKLRLDAHRFYAREGMHDFHLKFSKNLIGIDTAENELGR